MGGNMAFKAVSLFTGAGGLDVGLGRAGSFQLLACVELEPVYCATLTANRDRELFGDHDTAIIQADISLLDPYELMDRVGIIPGELDLLVGGPPCQSWSTAGRRRTANDPRGQLIWDYLRFIEAIQPRAFLMENVRGLFSAALRHRPIAERPEKGGPPLAADEMQGSAIAAWVDDLEKVSGGAYRVDAYEVNAVNYGAPQLRERILFFGNRDNAVIPFPAPTHGKPGSGLLPFATLHDALSGFEDPAPVVVDFSPRKKRYLDLVPPGGNWRALPYAVAEESMGRAFSAKGGRSGWWRRLSWDLPCPTITTLPNHASTSMCHPEETRTLSVGEFAKIQEFPNGWSFFGTPTEQMKQVGNAVPARLGEVAGRVLAEHLAGKSVAAPEAARFRRIYLDSHIRTRTWWKAGKAYIREGGEDSPTKR
jgi:DNA (cytosine-5)-methyltransferase 1